MHPKSVESVGFVAFFSSFFFAHHALVRVRQFPCVFILHHGMRLLTFDVSNLLDRSCFKVRILMTYAISLRAASIASVWTRMNYKGSFRLRALLFFVTHTHTQTHIFFRLLYFLSLSLALSRALFLSLFFILSTYHTLTGCVSHQRDSMFFS